MDQFLKALPTVASSPLAFIGYLIVVIAWVVTSIMSRRSSQLFKAIKDLPEKDKLAAIKLEYKTIPRAGVTAKEWLQAKSATYNLIRFGALVVVLLVVIGLAAYLASMALNAKRAAASDEELINILNYRARTIDTNLKKQGALKTEEEFERLHKENIQALKAGNHVESHELQRDIEGALKGTVFEREYEESPRTFRRELRDHIRASAAKAAEDKDSSKKRRPEPLVTLPDPFISKH
jgi:hypothetical protein